MRFEALPLHQTLYFIRRERKDLSGSRKRFWPSPTGLRDDMLAEAERFTAIDPKKMRIKVSATRAGLALISRLASEGHEVMATVVPTAAWLVFALAPGRGRSPRMAVCFTGKVW